MFGIFDAVVRVLVESGRVTAAAVVGGTWNPGMYATVSAAARESFQAAETAAPELARALVGAPALVRTEGFDMYPYPDGGYDWSVSHCRSVLAGVEVCAVKADLGYSSQNSQWCVVRGDDPGFAELVAMSRYAGEVRAVRCSDHYGDGTRYDFDGPC